MLEAIECFEQALAQARRCARAVRAGQHRAGAWPGAAGRDVFPPVLALEPERVEALVNLANLLRAQGQFAAAEALLLPALARDPDSPELWLTLGSVYRRDGRQ